MRKLFLASMLTLGMAGAAFASDNKVSTVDETVLKVTTTQTELKSNDGDEDEDDGCLDFTFSCGGTVEICHFGLVPTDELIAVLKDHNDYICGE